MRTSLLCAAVLACVLGFPAPSHATPGSRVNLVLSPSELAHAERCGRICLTEVEPPPKAYGQYVGPIWIDGVYAQQLRKLPRKMREGMAKPIGPSVTVVQSMHLGAGAGPGMYARF